MAVTAPTGPAPLAPGELAGEPTQVPIERVTISWGRDQNLREVVEAHHRRRGRGTVAETVRDLIWRGAKSLDAEPDAND